MHKYIGRALLKAVVGVVCVLSAPAILAQNHPVLAAANSLPDAPSGPASNSSLSPLPDGAITVIPVEAAPPAPYIAVQPKGPIVEIPREETHRFWDRENAILFTAVGAAATADFFTTRANLDSGGRELNPIARLFTGSTPMLATNFALETAGVIGISYMFHKTGHHKLERLTSFVDISSSAGAVMYGLTHR